MASVKRASAKERTKVWMMRVRDKPWVSEGLLKFSLVLCESHIGQKIIHLLRQTHVERRTSSAWPSVSMRGGPAQRKLIHTVLNQCGGVLHVTTSPGRYNWTRVNTLFKLDYYAKGYTVRNQEPGHQRPFWLYFIKFCTSLHKKYIYK
jgi:hypothetical protein